MSETGERLNSEVDRMLEGLGDDFGVDLSAMRAITLRQPWPYAIFNLDKLIENRSWWWSHLAGKDLAIHAGKEYDPTGEQWIYDSFGIRVPKLTVHYTSLILGVVTVKGAHLNSECVRPGGTYSCSRWAMGLPDGKRVYHWELDDIRQCRQPVPYRKGGRMIWKVQPSAAQAVLANI